MTECKGPTLTFPELFCLPVTVDLRTAARALGISVATARRLLQRDAFPCPVLRPGYRYRIPTSALMRVLQVESRPVHVDDVHAGIEFAAQLD
ncbi:helix-turn-helix domain-containing protein [Streptomyces sp. MZ04]|uniref:helix-turn-helix domain-containing protein n=1 Tax=Streptomyces sp. MZ04 TaxID=2559236 RepID=UPI00107E6DD6|nr:helix-turn-helix domain-containing protein [Streptomyces sp. MZ04]TGB05617.1 DNA-binding protein [Streptomyces sp. MZ04]